MRLGEFDWTDDEEREPHEDFNLKKVFIHEGFNGGNVSFDIALIELNRAVELKRHIQTICLPSKHARFEGEWAKLSGWGITKNGAATQPPKLREVHLEVVPCRGNSIPGAVICTAQDCRDNCKGDSGGPLSVVKDGRSVLIGVPSRGHCGEPVRPSRYTSVTFHLKWILKELH